MRNRADIALEWSMTLVEPLIDPRRRARVEEEFAAVTRSDPEWMAAFFGGVLADVAGTFPTYDPWRHLSARIGELTIGIKPPAALGARRPLGEVFGRLPSLEHPFGVRRHLDPSLVAIADDLAPAAAALVAFAHRPWAEVHTALGTLWQELVGEQMAGWRGPDDLPPTVETAVDAWHDAACTALRRVVFRRRTYWGGIDDDPAALDACFRWVVFATDVVAGEPLDEDVITGPIELGRELLTDLHQCLHISPGAPMPESENEPED